MVQNKINSKSQQLNVAHKNTHSLTPLLSINPCMMAFFESKVWDRTKLMYKVLLETLSTIQAETTYES